MSELEHSIDDPRVVAVDGPAGSGKSSICAKISQRIGWSYVNTGALYRALGYLANEKNVDIYNDEAMTALTEDFAEHLIWQDNEQRLYYATQDLTDELQSEAVGRNASRIARIPQLRKNLLQLQRDLAKKSNKGSLVDGRDIGSVVFPDADLKIFLTASLDVRAQRRFSQLQEYFSQQGLEASAESKSLDIADIKSEIAARDEQDLNREIAPLVRPADAILVDTSDLTVEQTIDRIISLIREHIPVS